MATDGIIYTWGNNENCRLGLYNGVCTFVNTPTVLEGTWGSSGVVLKVSAGETHGLALVLVSSSTKVYIWGEEAVTYAAISELSTSGRTFFDVTAGFKCSFMIETTNHVYAQGLASKGKLGTGNLINKLSIVRVSTGPIDKIYSAGDTTFIKFNVTSALNVFGSNADGNAGISSYDSPLFAHKTVFESSFGGRSVMKIAQGLKDTSFLVEYKCYGFFESDTSVCSGHGTCASTDTCDCQTGYR